MATLVCKVGIKREEGYLYFIDQQGDVARCRLQSSGTKRKSQKVAKIGIVREDGKLYFLDSKGHISYTKMNSQVRRLLLLKKGKTYKTFGTGNLGLEVEERSKRIQFPAIGSTEEYTLKQLQGMIKNAQKAIDYIKGKEISKPKPNKGLERFANLED